MNLRLIILIFSFVFITACSSSGPSLPELPSSEFAAVTTLDIDINANQAELEAQYNGKAIVFKPEEGFAILGLYKDSELGLETSAVDNVYAIPEAGGWNAWAGGWNAWAGGWNAWAGGWNAWAGGWNAWAGGNKVVPNLPYSNRTKLNKINLPEAHAISTEYGKGIVVAVIDTGIQLGHPMFQGRLVPSNKDWDFYGNDGTPAEGGSVYQAYGHGTAVAGAILQVAPKAKIMPLRALKSNGQGDTDDIIEAITWAVDKGADVINLSLGTIDAVTSLNSIINYATSKGVYVVSSAGNTGNVMTYPALKASRITREKFSISVGSTNINGQRSSFSAYNGDLEIMAPGEQIFSAFPGSKTAHLSGTSFAAPLVSGAIALGLSELKARNATQGQLDNMQAYLLNSAATIGGRKVLDVLKMVRTLPGYTSVQPNVLLVTNNTSTSLHASDVAIKNRLQNLGYRVHFRTHNNVDLSAANGKQLIVISSSVSHTKVSSLFRDIAIPVVVMDHNLYPIMKMTGSTLNSGYGQGSTSSNITYKNISHPLKAGHTGTTTKIHTTGKTIPWGNPKSSAYRAATPISPTTRYAVFGYDKGKAMYGLSAPARRAAFPSYNAGGIHQLSTKGKELFDAVITWTASGN